MAERKGKAGLKRVEFLRDKHADAVQDLFTDPGLPGYSRLAARGAPAVFDYLLATDPTPKAIYLQSVIRWFLKGTVRIEDARRVRKALTRFHANKAKLDVADRDINTYHSPGDIEALFDRVEAAGGTAVREIPPDVLAEGPVLASGDDWVLVRLDTYRASRWWADSTSWCTRHQGMYDNYSSRGPLYVLSWKGTKIQCSMAAGQFMDRYDRLITPDLARSFPEAAYHALHNRLLEDSVAGSPLRGTLAGTGVDMFHDAEGAPLARIVPAEPFLALNGIHRIRNCWAMLEGRSVRGLVFMDARTGRLHANPVTVPLEKLDDRHLQRDNTRPEAAALLHRFSQAAGQRFLDQGHRPLASEEGKSLYRSSQTDLPLPSGKDTYLVFDGRRLAGAIRLAPGHEWTGRQTTAITVHTYPEGRVPVTTQPKGRTDLRASGPVPDLLRFAFRHIRPTTDLVTAFGTSLVDGKASERWFRDDPDWLTSAVAVLQSLVHRVHGPSADMDLLGDVLDTLAPTPERALALAAAPQVMSMSRTATVMQALAARCPPEGRRLVESIRGGLLTMQRRPSARASGQDLLAVADIPHTGHLLAALAPEERTPELVADLLRRGRGGCIAALPPRLATHDAVRAAYATGETEVAAVSLDSVGVRLLRNVRQVVSKRRRPSRPRSAPALPSDPWDDIGAPASARLPEPAWANADTFASVLVSAAGALHGGELEVVNAVERNPQLAPYFYPDGLDAPMVPGLKLLHVHRRPVCLDILSRVADHPIESLPFAFVLGWTEIEASEGDPARSVGQRASSLVRNGAWAGEGAPMSQLEALLAADPALLLSIPLSDLDDAARVRVLLRNRDAMAFMQPRDLTPRMALAVADAVSRRRKAGRSAEADVLATDVINRFAGSPDVWRERVYALLETADASVAERLSGVLPWPVTLTEARSLGRASRLLRRRLQPFGARPDLPWRLRLEMGVLGLS